MVQGLRNTGFSDAVNTGKFSKKGPIGLNYACGRSVLNVIERKQKPGERREVSNSSFRLYCRIDPI